MVNISIAGVPHPCWAKVHIKNYRAFKDFDLEFSPGINIIVGNNDAGKSTLLEAINLALTARLHGGPISSELSPYLFNQETTQQYVRDLREGKRPSAPEIVIELYLDHPASSCRALTA